MTRTSLFSLALLLCVTAADARQRAVRVPTSTWQQPACAFVTGLPTVVFSTDEGNTFVSNAEPLPMNESTVSISATETPNVLLAVKDAALYESRDAGCTWRFLDMLGRLESLPRLVGSWIVNEELLIKVESGRLSHRFVPDRVAGVGFDRHDPKHLRAIARSGTAYESFDEGLSWTRVGEQRRELIYTAEFNPADVNHVVIGRIGGVVTSRDGGRTWSATKQPELNAMYVAFSPVDPHIVWVNGAVPSSMGDALYRSEDGGETFRRVGVFGRGPLAPHPRDPNEVVVVSALGTAVFDLRTNAFRPVRTPAGVISAATWSPAGTLYVGISDITFF